MSNPTPPAPKQDNTPAINKLRSRLIAAINKISQRSNTQLRSLIDSFTRHLSPSMSHNGDSSFSVTIRPHKNDREATSNPGLASVLVFHIGNAVLGYYDAINGTSHSTFTKVSDRSIGGGPGSVTVGTYHCAMTTFEARVKLIEEIAHAGAENYGVVGSDSVGYKLLTRAKIKEAIDALEKQQEKDWNA